MVLLSQAVMQAIAEGAREFDLLRGDESYKYEWKAAERRTLRLIGGSGTLRSRLALLCSRVERYVEHHGLRLQRRLWGRRPQDSDRRSKKNPPGEGPRS